MATESGAEGLGFCSWSRFLQRMGTRHWRCHATIRQHRNVAKPNWIIGAAAA
ncbi:MAG: hypothetical protein IT577_21710 [Verrucomicrobiae bacterium]|nr:hypothetical protein [Verrucomicrobiae bacterium]